MRCAVCVGCTLICGVCCCLFVVFRVSFASCCLRFVVRCLFFVDGCLMSDVCWSLVVVCVLLCVVVCCCLLIVVVRCLWLVV